MTRAAEAACLGEDVGIELGGSPALGRADLVGGQAEGAAHVCSGYIGAADFCAAKNSGGEGRAAQIRVAQVCIHQDRALELSAGHVGFEQFCGGEIGLLESGKREDGVFQLGVTHVGAR